MAIKSYANPAMEAAFNGERHRSLPADIRAVAQRKLHILHAATRLDMLRIPPGNRLEALEGGDAYDVEIVDYH